LSADERNKSFYGSWLLKVQLNSWNFSSQILKALEQLLENSVGAGFIADMTLMTSGLR